VNDSWALAAAWTSGGAANATNATSSAASTSVTPNVLLSACADCNSSSGYAVATNDPAAMLDANGTTNLTLWTFSAQRQEVAEFILSYNESQYMSNFSQPLPPAQDQPVQPGSYFLINRATRSVLHAVGSPCISPNVPTGLCGAAMPIVNVSRVFFTGRPVNMPGVIVNLTYAYAMNGTNGTNGTFGPSLPNPTKNAAFTFANAVLAGHNVGDGSLQARRAARLLPRDVVETWKVQGSFSLSLESTPIDVVHPMIIDTNTTNEVVFHIRVVQAPDKVVIQPAFYRGWFLGVCADCGWNVLSVANQPVVLMRTNSSDPRVVWQAVPMLWTNKTTSAGVPMYQAVDWLKRRISGSSSSSGGGP